MPDTNDDMVDPILERKRAQAQTASGADEARIEQEERAALTGPAKLQYATWFIIGLVIAFLLLIVGYGLFL